MKIKPRFAAWRDKLYNEQGQNSRLAVLVVALVVAVPVVLIATVSYVNTKREITAADLSRKQAVVTLAAATLQEKLNRLTDLGVSFGTRVRFRQLVQAGKWQDAVEILANVPRDFPFIERLFIADVSGTLMADTPELTGVRGTKFVHRDWYQGVKATGRPYVSEVYQRTAKPQYLVIAQATPISKDNGEMAGILVLQVRTATFLQWVHSMDTATEGNLVIVDRRGKTVAHPQLGADREIADYSQLPPVRAVLQGKRGVEVGIDTGEGEPQVIAYEPIAGFGWGVIFKQRQSQAFALRDSSLLRLQIAYLMVGLATICVAFLVLRVVNSRILGERKFRDLVEAAPDGLVIADADGNITLSNAQAERLFGYARQEMVGRPVEILMPERFRAQHPGHRQNFLRSPRPRPMGAGLELHGRRKDGSEFPLSISLSPLKTDEGMLVISSIRDISERKNLEAQLRAQNELLQQQNREVQEANRMKSEFLANMSHELRTPLNAIIGFAEIMHDGKVGAITANHKEFLGDILASGRHLLDLINDILDLSKVEAGKIELTPGPVELTILIGDVRQILQPLSAAKRLEVTVEVCPDVEQLFIDPARLKQVLYNYLSNAIKFTPEEGRITVRALADGPDRFRLEVADTGIGIAAEDIAKLFVEFQQLETGTAKKHQGTGLGLALTKKIVEALGGCVGVQSVPQRGSVFYAVLPRLAEQVDAAAAPIAALPAGDSPAVLVIEDDENDRRWLTRILAEAGYTVDSAVTGAEGIAKAQARAYSGVLLDLILPDGGGWEVLNSIRAGGQNQQVPVIVVTVVAERGIARGFPIQDYLVKPVQPQTLLDAFEKAGIRPNGTSKKILVVDDDQSTLKYVRVALQSSGYEAVCHGIAEKGLKAAAETEFAAVVLDLLMPGMDGFEFLDRFRNIEGCRNIPVIVWTGKDLDAEEIKRLKKSAQSVALKSRARADDILSELRRCVGHGDAATLQESI